MSIYKLPKEIEEEFFDQLSNVLENEFPKEQCKERGHALVLNSYANILFRKILAREIQKAQQEQRERIDNKPIKKGSHIDNIIEREKREERERIIREGESFMKAHEKEYGTEEVAGLFGFLEQLKKQI